MEGTFDILVIGGGASGTLLSAQLLRQLAGRPGGGPLRVAWVDRAGAFGRGVAYGTEAPWHLLNVPAGRMSALPGEPEHLLRWLAREGVPAGPADFVPRGVYGRYLCALLAEAERRAGGRAALVRVQDEVVALEERRDGVVARLAEGGRLRAQAAVLALGNPPPADVAVPDGGLYASARYVGAPWAPGALEGVGREEAVLLVGTGLTAVDVLLTLQERGHRGPVHALSRHGLLPRSHRPAHPPVAPLVSPGGPLRLRPLLRAFRARVAAGEPWHAVLDALRPLTPALWQALPLAERRRFLRHLQPWWDTHRHRMAPPVARALAALRQQGQLQVHAGRLTRFELRPSGVQVHFRPRGHVAHRTLEVARVLNCTGPASLVGPRAPPLVRQLLGAGLARADALGLGLDTVGGALRDAAGRPSAHLFALGPARRGELWETTAVPEIRVQAEALAGQLLAARGAEEGVADGR